MTSADEGPLTGLPPPDITHQANGRLGRTEARHLPANIKIHATTRPELAIAVARNNLIGHRFTSRNAVNNRANRRPPSTPLLKSPVRFFGAT